MPNWCDNELTVVGPKDQLKEFKKKAKQRQTKKLAATELSLAKLYPEPDYNVVKVEPTFPAITKEVRKGEEWWDWRVQHWGTKWDVKASVDDNGSRLFYWFDSAWSPPIEAILHISRDWPELKFDLSYSEPGAYFQGWKTIVMGEIIAGEDGEYDNSQDECWVDPEKQNEGYYCETHDDWANSPNQMCPSYKGG